MKVYVASVGDSVACLFDVDTGALMTSQVRVWDEVRFCFNVFFFCQTWLVRVWEGVRVWGWSV